MERLAELRESRALTLKQLAEMSGVNANTINRIELGRTEARPSTVRKLASALGVSVGELERPIDWRAHYLQQEAEHAEHLIETVKLAQEALETDAPKYVARALELLGEGLRGMSESLHEAHRIETGGKKTTPEKGIDDQLSALLREWEAEKAS